MVSFQCDGCADTVKKPKLDQHYQRCHSSVTCIDCSTTFHLPAEFKKHTQCISEAEKYQKALYKGPKHNGQQNTQQNGRPHANGAAPNYAAGKYQRGGWTPRSQASGTNGTPLGTPIRMSPVFDVDPGEASAVAPKVAGTSVGDADAKTEGVEEKKNGALADGVNKNKKDRKRKATADAEPALATADTEPPAKKIKVVKDATPSSPSNAQNKSKKEKKRRAKDAEDAAMTVESAPETSKTAEQSTAPMEDEGEPTTRDKKKKSKKVRTGEASAEADSGNPSVESPLEESKKRKREKGKKTHGEDAVAVGAAVVEDDLSGKVEPEGKPQKKKKQRKREDEDRVGLDVSGEGDAAPPPAVKEKKKKRKEKGAATAEA